MMKIKNTPKHGINFKLGVFYSLDMIHPMSLKKIIESEHNKAQAMKIVKYIGRDPERFKELMKLFLGTEYRISQRAAWPLGICGERYPELIRPYLTKLIAQLDAPVHDAVKRNIMRIFQFIELPEKHMGRVAEKCFYYLSTPSEPIAVRVFAMTVLLGITQKHPELKQEFKIVIEDQLPYASAGFISRARKTIKELDKIN